MGRELEKEGQELCRPVEKLCIHLPKPGIAVWFLGSLLRQKEQLRIYFCVSRGET